MSGDIVPAPGISRRRFLRLLSLGSAAAVLAACTRSRRLGVGPTGNGRAAATGPTEPAAAGEIGGVSTGPSPFFKDEAPFIRHPGGVLESRLELQRGSITPNRLFFVRNNSDRATRIDESTWHLSVEGDAVERPLELSYSDIRSLPSRRLVCYLECAGNHRSMFEVLNGQPTKGTQWGTGAIGNAEWTGVPLRDVLTAAGITPDAVSVLLVGLDTGAPEGGFRRVLPTQKAMHPDTILAYEMNGEDLPRDHGFPLRAVVPGWVGSSSIKWLGQILVSSEQVWTRNNTTSYVLVGEDYAAEGPSEGAVVTTQVINSALALGWPAELRAGSHRISGYASSPSGPVTRVEWSADSGESWSDADVETPESRCSWTMFAFTWEARPGEHTLMTRAGDAAGNTQPEVVPFNAKGYLFNQPLPHPVRVV